MNLLSNTDTHSAKGKQPAGNRGWAHTDPQQKFFILADGTGPLAPARAAAGRLAVTTVRQELQRHAKWAPLRIPRANRAPTLAALSRAVHEAHRVLHARARHDAAMEAMGSTLLIGSLQADHCICVAIGDSRLYRFSEGRLAQITRHQSLGGQPVAEGFLEPGDERAGSHAYRHSAVIGGRILPSIQQYRIPFRKGDTLLACSNDLSAQMPDGQIESLLQRSNGAHLMNRLAEENPLTPLIVVRHEADPVTARSGRSVPLRTEWRQTCRSYAW